ncbi:MAG: hypothetical protein MUE60_08195 [Candidatus Eisenbacteria bacterium]|jgi:hypothetical protein|nr:hypothetical protein [Candidatus Eisenbacteria bacterium]
MNALRYDYRDVFGAAAMGLRVRKWMVALPGVSAGLVWWSLCGWAALIARGLSPALVWNVYGPVPWPSLSSLGGILPATLWGLGMAGAAVTWMLAFSAVGRVTYQQLKGNDFYSLAEAWRFTLRKWKALVFPPVLLSAGGGALLLALFVLSILGGLWLPLWGIVFPLGLLAALSLLYLVVVLAVAITMAPAVVASSASETLETTFELFSLQSSQGKRMWFYTALSAIVSGVYAAALGFLLGVGTLAASWALDMGQGGAVGRLLRASLGWSPRLAAAINGVPGVLDSFLIGIGISPAMTHRSYVLTPPASTFGGVSLALMFLLLLLLILAQFVTAYATSQTTAYVVLRQLKDDQNLLEEDLEE